MKLFILGLFGRKSLAQDYEGSGSNYNFDMEYIGSIAENFEAVQDYFDSTSIIGARSLGDIGGIERNSLPPGVNLQDFVSANGSFNMEAFRESLSAALAAQENVQNDEERYFFTQASTTSTTTTTTTTTGLKGTTCWKCDQMSYSECSAKGDFEVCSKGDKDCCFVEVRENNQALQQLCTGCKSRDACENLRDENFHNDNRNPQRRNRNFDQCRPDYRLQYAGRRGRNTQSVCRQCFNTCLPDDATNDGGSFCFGGSITKNSHHYLGLKLSTNKAFFPWGNHYQPSSDHVGLGIPIAVVDPAADIDVVNEIQKGTPNGIDSKLRNVYFYDSTATSGNEDGKAKSSQSVMNGVRDKDQEMVYWGLQGASEEWWRQDLKKIQNDLRNKGSPVGTVALNTHAYVASDFVPTTN